MNTTDVTAVRKLLSSPKKIAIIPHKNPDGDAMGSSLGLWFYLKKSGHDAHVIAPNDYPKFLKWLPGNDEVVIYEQAMDTATGILKDADIIFTLDFNALNRTGGMEPLLRRSDATFIMIDHHRQPEDYPHYKYSDPEMCSTSEMIYHFFDKLDVLNVMNQEIATCLYAGIMTDTGSFRFASTTSTTHRVVAGLIDNGADNSYIHSQVYDNQSYNRLQLLGRALNNLHVIRDLHTAYITLTNNDLNTFKFQKGDTEGVVNYALAVEGVVFAVIFI